MNMLTQQQASPDADALPPGVDQGLSVLLRAHQYSQQLSCNVWDFAVEISSLREVGLDNSDLRWLVCEELVEHAREVTPPSDDERVFRPSGRLNFSKRTCFVLTQQGAVRLTQTTNGCTSRTPKVVEDTEPEEVTIKMQRSRPVLHAMPKWDRDRQELRVEGVLVKAFKLPSPNQETILMAFDEEGWPPRIDDPLPQRPDMDPKRRLHDTIKSLNRNQKNRMIRFMGDGTGQGVRWEFFKSAADPEYRMSGNGQGKSS